MVLFLINDYSDWDLDIEDIEEYLLEKQASNMLDYTGMMRGYYWSGNKLSNNEINYPYLISRITSLTNLVPFLSFLTKENEQPLLTGTKSRLLKNKHLYNANNFKHSASLEWFFFSIPTVIVFKIIYPSLALICETDTEVFDPDLIVKVQGSQWYWSYDVNLLLI